MIKLTAPSLSHLQQLRSCWMIPYYKKELLKKVIISLLQKMLFLIDTRIEKIVFTENVTCDYVMMTPQ